VRVELQEQMGHLQVERTAQGGLKERISALEREMKGDSADVVLSVCLPSLLSCCHWAPSTLVTSNPPDHSSSASVTRETILESITWSCIVTRYTLLFPSLQRWPAATGRRCWTRRANAAPCRSGSACATWRSSACGRTRRSGQATCTAPCWPTCRARRWATTPAPRNEPSNQTPKTLTYYKSLLLGSTPPPSLCRSLPAGVMPDI